MEVTVSSDVLSSAVPFVADALDRVLEERRHFGFSLPGQFSTEVRLYSGPDFYCDAESLANGEALVSLNVLPRMQRVASEEDRTHIACVTDYFDLVRGRFGAIPEADVLQLLTDPERKLEEIGAALVEETRAKLVDDAPAARSALDTLHRSIPAGIQNMEADPALSSYHILRHELDHVDFFASPWYRGWINVVSQRDLLKARIDRHEDEAVEPYFEATKKTLALQTEILPAFEGRALMFNKVTPHDWKAADLDNAARSAHKHFEKEYLDNFLRLCWREIKSATAFYCDLETASYLYGTHLPPSDIPQGINAELVGELTEYVMGLQQACSQNADTVFSVIADAYREPARVRASTQAESFEHFIELCRG